MASWQEKWRFRRWGPTEWAPTPRALGELYEVIKLGRSAVASLRSMQAP